MELHVGSHAVCMCRKRDLNAETHTHPCGRRFSYIPEDSLLQEQLVLSENRVTPKGLGDSGIAGPLLRLIHAVKSGGSEGGHCDVSPTMQTRKNWIS